MSSGTLAAHRSRRQQLFDVFGVDVGVPDCVPGLPGDAEDDEGDRETDDRVGSLEADSDEYSAYDDSERDEPIDASVLAVSDHRRAREPSASPEPDLSRQLVADEADKPRRCKRPKMGQLLGVDEAHDRLVERHARRDEDRKHDCKP